jgi:hypothetical protein
MHCPNCGTSATKQQKFCRACGFGLAKVVQLLEEGDVFPDELSRLYAERRQKIERWRDLAFYLLCGGAGIVVPTFIGYIIYQEMIIKWDQWDNGDLWEAAGVLFAILAALVGLALLSLSLRAEELKKAEAKLTQVKPLPRPANYPSLEALPPAATTSNLLAEGRVESVASITEDTTRSLQPHG